MAERHEWRTAAFPFIPQLPCGGGGGGGTHDKKDLLWSFTKDLVVKRTGEAPLGPYRGKQHTPCLDRAHV